MKTLAAMLCLGFGVAACDAPVEQAQAPSPDATAIGQDAQQPVVLNRGFLPKRTAWKDRHFFTPDEEYGPFTYFAFSRLAIAVSVDCNAPLDGLYLDAAEAAGRRALFQNKAAREAKTKAAIDAFDREYGPFDPNDSATLCSAVARNKAEETLFGAFFF